MSGRVDEKRSLHDVGTRQWAYPLSVSDIQGVNNERIWTAATRQQAPQANFCFGTPQVLNGTILLTCDHALTTRVRKVEDVLFRVPRSQLIENSGTFRAMFTLPQAATGTIEGDTDDEPIQLQGVSKVDFERLLKFMYRRNEVSPLETSHEEWISILKALDDVGDDRNTQQRISLGEKYDVPALVTSGIVALVNQRGGVSEEQTVILGFEMALCIQRIRVKLLENCLSIQPVWPGQPRTRPPGVFSESNDRVVARDVFHGERSFSEPEAEEAEEVELASKEAMRMALKAIGFTTA
ncbi:hypothetical protein ARMGADRAFT_1086050 [Armillaria gallica]|uniref:BTB domain-containing protein n=1 Tax=Armillaria gallica TaxID=47427 RepID=A0A2H3CV77_ARMGA|nr:hypothetical protein ARMGADRAFT_1086050 [Armillaria gallica]